MTFESNLLLKRRRHGYNCMLLEVFFFFPFGGSFCMRMCKNIICLGPFSFGCFEAITKYVSSGSLLDVKVNHDHESVLL